MAFRTYGVAAIRLFIGRFINKAQIGFKPRGHMSLRESYYEKLQPVIDYLTTNREPSATRDFHQTLLAGAAHHARWEHETYVKGGEDAKINPVFTVADEPFDFAGEANRALERACKYEADVRAIALP